MDMLEVFRLAEEKGGTERKAAIRKLLRHARDLGCVYSTGGGKVGGFNIRYGSLNYSILDVNTDGSVFLHVNPDSTTTMADEERDRRNNWLDELDGVTLKNGPIQNYGQIAESIEEIPEETLTRFLEFTVQNIRDTFYKSA